jgi:hypothetical protein
MRACDRANGGYGRNAASDLVESRKYAPKIQKKRPRVGERPTIIARRQESKDEQDLPFSIWIAEYRACYRFSDRSDRKFQSLTLIVRPMRRVADAFPGESNPITAG